MTQDLLQQRDQYKELMLQAYGPAGSTLETPTKSKGTLSAVAEVFSARKDKQVVAQLTFENDELKKLERLRPQLMELQQKLSNLQKDADDAEKLRNDEISILTEHNKELAAALKQAHKAAEKSISEKEDGLKLANEWSVKAERAEREVRKLSEELEEFKDRITDMTTQSIDPIVVDQLNDKIVELESKGNHVKI